MVHSKVCDVFVYYQTCILDSFMKYLCMIKLCFHIIILVPDWELGSNLRCVPDLFLYCIYDSFM